MGKLFYILLLSTVNLCGAENMNYSNGNYGYHKYGNEAVDFIGLVG